MQGAGSVAPHVRKLRHVPRQGGGGRFGETDEERTKAQRTRVGGAGDRETSPRNGGAVERGGTLKKVNQEVGIRNQENK